MCGIVGILGKGPVAWPLVDALRRLEYRGYDSAGIATIEKGRIERVRASGTRAGPRMAFLMKPTRIRISRGMLRLSTMALLRITAS